MDDYNKFLEDTIRSWKHHVTEHDDGCTLHQWMDGILDFGGEAECAFAKTWLAAQTVDEDKQINALIRVAETMGLYAAAQALRNKFQKGE